MWKCLTSFVVGIVGTLALLFYISFSTGGEIPSLLDGHYTVYGVLKVVEPRTGKPAYWVVAGKGTVESSPDHSDVYIEPVQPKLFSIRPDMFPTGQNAMPGAIDVHSYRIEVTHGSAKVVR